MANNYKSSVDPQYYAGYIGCNIYCDFVYPNYPQKGTCIQKCNNYLNTPSNYSATVGNATEYDTSMNWANNNAVANGCSSYCQWKYPITTNSQNEVVHNQNFTDQGTCINSCPQVE